MENPFETKKTINNFQFLKVLCILTFIGCALTFVLTIWGYIGADKAPEQMRESIEKLSSGASSETMEAILNNSLEMAEKQKEYKLIFAAVGIVCVVLCAYGASRMWKLKKEGYYIYLIGEIVPILLSLILLGKYLFANKWTAISSVIMLFVFPLAFIIMYTVNAKHLEK
jgi:uncharacterized protein YacL